MSSATGQKPTYNAAYAEAANLMRLRLFEDKWILHAASIGWLPWAGDAGFTRDGLFSDSCMLPGAPSRFQRQTSTDYSPACD
jgi:hypothetical protein